MKPPDSVIAWSLRLALLLVLHTVLFMAGAMAVAGHLPPADPSQPGLVPEGPGVLLIGLANVTVVALLVRSSRWRGWKLAAALACAYYGAVTFVMQIETWYFLSKLTVTPELLPRLFLMGLPVACLFVPAAVWLLGRDAATADPLPPAARAIPPAQWAWKLAMLAAAYLVLYWTAGYFIAWQNPELRAFYGAPGEALSFWAQTVHTLEEDPMLFPFQALRSLVWVLCALPVIRGSRLAPWPTALLVGAFLSVPQNIGHILANPLIPVASARLSHLLETASSTFVFGLVMVWLLHRRHRSPGDLLGIGRTGEARP